jgi:hypothetical protein
MSVLTLAPEDESGVEVEQNEGGGNKEIGKKFGNSSRMEPDPVCLARTPECVTEPYV